MTAGVAGLLLPESVLTSPWFLLLATVVAFNTIIYVGLTLAKLIPWPQQFHPQWVRDKAERLGVNPSEEKVMPKTPESARYVSDDPYEILREDYPRLSCEQLNLLFELAGQQNFS